MSFYYLSSYHKSYSSRAAQLASISLKGSSSRPQNALLVCRDAQLEAWVELGEDFHLAQTFKINMQPHHFFCIKSLGQKEDALLVISEDKKLFLLSIQQGKLITRNKMSLDYKSLEDLQVLYCKKPNENLERFFYIFDRNSEIIIYKITEREGQPNIDCKFRVFSMVNGVHLFPVSIPKLKTSDDSVLLGMVSGSPIYHHYMSFIEVSSIDGKVISIEERKDIDLSPKDSID